MGREGKSSSMSTNTRMSAKEGKKERSMRTWSHGGREGVREKGREG